jgi:hypothetical protein
MDKDLNLFEGEGFKCALLQPMIPRPFGLG